MKDWVLIVTNKDDLTADFVVLELTRRGWPFCRFNTEDFPYLGTAGLDVNEDSGFLECPAHPRIKLADIRSVWYRRPHTLFIPGAMEPGMLEFCERETNRFLAGLYSYMDAFWVSHPNRLREAENKPLQLRLAKKLGFKVPRTVITNSPAEVLDLFEACGRNMVAKPVRTGYIPGDPGYAVFTTLLKPSDLDDLTGLQLAPVIFQEYVDKIADVRVTVMGKTLFAVEISSQEQEETRVDWRHAPTRPLMQRVHTLPKAIGDLCLSLGRALGLEFGAIDLVLSPDGEYTFLEINPNGQWAWLEQELGLPLTATLTDLLQKGHRNG